MIENKVIYVNAFFKPVGKNVTFEVPTGEKKKGLFGGEKEITSSVGWVERSETHRISDWI